jgi:hypothetical protein
VIRSYVSHASNEIKQVYHKECCSRLFCFLSFPRTHAPISSLLLFFAYCPYAVFHTAILDGLRAAAAAPGFSNIRRDDEPTTHVRFVDFG